MAHIVITYFLWLFGGWVGLHHFYLGRDRQAFVWWATWGGCFGLGWIRDLWRIPEYIFYANEDNGYLEEYKERTKRYKVPPFCVTRFAGEMVMGYVLGMLVRLSIPEEYTTDGIGPFLAVFLPPIAVAIGVHTVANIQPQNSEIKWPLIGAFCALPWLLNNSQNLIYSSVISAIATNWKGKQWDLKRRKRRGFCFRVSTLTFWGTLYLSFWVSTIYFNASVTTRAGDTIPLREAIPNFINSPAWAEMKESLKHFYEYYQIHGFEKLWEEIIEKLDPIGETRAFKVLGLEEDATEKEIKDRYRKLAREWHPDKEKDPKKKAKAQEKFVEIQKAYETLSKIKSKRARKNRADRVKEEHSWRYSSDD